jgi:hypothetical protein
VSLVLDSSATLAWIYSDETTEPIRRVFQAVADDGAVVPALWRLEIANSLTPAVRRGRIDVNRDPLGRDENCAAGAPSRADPVPLNSCEAADHYVTSKRTNYLTV